MNIIRNPIDDIIITEDGIEVLEKPKDYSTDGKHWIRQIIIDEDEGGVPDTYIPRLSETLQKCGLV